MVTVSPTWYPLPELLMPLRLYAPDPFVDTVNFALVPLPLVLDCETFENVDAPVAVPLVVAAVIPDAAVPAADALIAPDTGELPVGDAV